MWICTWMLSLAVFRWEAVADMLIDAWPVFRWLMSELTWSCDGQFHVYWQHLNSCICRILCPYLRLSAVLWQLAQTLAGNPGSAKDLISLGQLSINKGQKSLNDDPRFPVLQEENFEGFLKHPSRMEPVSLIINSYCYLHWLSNLSSTLIFSLIKLPGIISQINDLT